MFGVQEPASTLLEPDALASGTRRDGKAPAWFEPASDIAKPPPCDDGPLSTLALPLGPVDTLVPQALSNNDPTTAATERRRATRPPLMLFPGMPNRMSDETTHFFALALNEVSIPDWVHLAVVLD